MTLDLAFQTLNEKLRFGDPAQLEALEMLRIRNEVRARICEARACGLKDWEIPGPRLTHRSTMDDLHRRVLQLRLLDEDLSDRDFEAAIKTLEATEQRNWKRWRMR